MEAGLLLLENQLLMPALASFTSGRLSPRNTSYLHVNIHSQNVQGLDDHDIPVLLQ